MTISDIAVIATFVMLVVAAIDAVRGKTALGKFRLSKKDEDPTRFWFAIVLYVNMAFGLFWLASVAGSTEPQEAPTEDQRPTVTIRTTDT
ncbi:MAG: hypothetical protein GW855_13620 [Erythrobacter sp.]|nr:hypothetical protein [Erythrobacter sp.]NCQ62899.1 hypothetical protein [Alphaproteobacteria bacterium]